MNNITTVPLHDLEERFFLSGDELEKAWRGSLPKIEYIEIRWKYLKKEVILSDMSQILRFSQQSEISFLQRNRVYEEMNLLLFKLREKKWGKFYFRVIAIIEKYLIGIGKFLSGGQIQEIGFYKKLFEGTMIAIIEEVKSLGEVQSFRVSE